MLKKIVRRLSWQHGTTLVEGLVTVLIYALIVGAVSMVLLSGAASWQVNSTKVELQQGLRRASEWMSKDLRQAGNSASSITNVPADGTWYNTITFKTAAGVSGGSITWSTDTIQYVVGGSGNNELQRINGSGTRVIALNMTSLQIRRQNATADMVEVVLQAQKRATSGQLLTLSTNFSVHLRN